MAKLSSKLSPHLTEEVVTKLAKRNIHDIVTFLEQNSELLSTISGLHYRDVVSIKNVLLLQFSSKCRILKDYIDELGQGAALLSSGIQKVDALLDGGFLTGYLYEFCGESGSGKSQLCMMIAANVSATFKQKVFYIDTKKDFFAQRICSFMENMTADAQGSLGRITISRPDNIYQLLNCLFDYVKRSEASKECARLVVLDSLSTIFSETSNYKKMNTLLSNVADVLRYIAVELHSVVLVTNHISKWDGLEKVGLGNFWFCVPQFRLALSRIPSETLPSYSCTLTRGSILPLNRSTTIRITDEVIN